MDDGICNVCYAYHLVTLLGGGGGERGLANLIVNYSQQIIAGQLIELSVCFPRINTNGIQWPTGVQFAGKDASKHSIQSRSVEVWQQAVRIS